MEVIEPKVTEKQHFDKRVEPFSWKTSGTLDSQYFDARIIINISSIESSFAALGLPSETLPEEIRPEAIEKSVIDYREISEKYRLLGLFGF